METESNTPDFILAGYLDNCLEIFNLAVEARDKFYGESHVIDTVLSKRLKADN